MKKHKKQNKPKHDTTAQQAKTNIDIIKGVNCTKGILITLEDCRACDYHKEMVCTLKGRKQKIEVVPYMHAMLFNRNLFQNATDVVREDSVNYYFKTDVMNSVNFITGYPNYTEARKRYVKGASTIREADPDYKIAPFESFDIMLFLKQIHEVANCDIMVDDRKYMITTPFDHKGDWEILMYLYNTYSLEGFADYKIQGVGYKVLFKPVDGYPVDFIIARKDDKLIVGKIK